MIEAAVKQDRILRQNQQFMIQLTELSKKTFHISSKVASAIGKTKISMNRTISELEQKQISTAKKNMKNIKGIILSGQIYEKNILAYKVYCFLNILQDFLSSHYRF